MLHKLNTHAFDLALKVATCDDRDYDLMHTLEENNDRMTGTPRNPSAYRDAQIRRAFPDGVPGEVAAELGLVSGELGNWEHRETLMSYEVRAVFNQADGTAASCSLDQLAGYVAQEGRQPDAYGVYEQETRGQRHVCDFGTLSAAKSFAARLVQS